MKYRPKKVIETTNETKKWYFENIKFIRGQGQRLRGAIPHLRSGAVAERSYPMSEVGGGDLEELPHARGKEHQLCFSGAAVNRYPTSKVRETQVRW